VTGAAGGGIGTAIARRLAADGHAVVLNGLPSHRPALDALAAQLGVERTLVAAFDVGEPAGVRAAVERAVAELGGVDVVVHNAAEAGPAVGAHELSDDTWRRELATVLDGAFYLARATAPGMIVRGWGRLVFIGSNVARRGTRGRNAGYVAAKAALHGLGRQLALELGPYGVTVNVVAPSQTDTPRIRRDGRRTDASLAAYGSAVPRGRVGRPADVAELVAFLVGDSADYLTGTVIPVDGGSALAPVSSAVRGAASGPAAVPARENGGAG